jgi:SAM-dependent methyltransferase
MAKRGQRRTTTEESRTIERFRPRHGRRGTAAERAVERAGIGANLDVIGYTTLAQAGELGRRLSLRPGSLLLDLGCGRGHPGLYLARTTGCRVVGSDLPVASLKAAARRAARERTGGRVSFVAASAVHLPFATQSFDAVVHTDVLC